MKITTRKIATIIVHFAFHFSLNLLTDFSFSFQSLSFSRGGRLGDNSFFCEIGRISRTKKRQDSRQRINLIKTRHARRQAINFRKLDSASTLRATRCKRVKRTGNNFILNGKKMRERKKGREEKRRGKK